MFMDQNLGPADPEVLRVGKGHPMTPELQHGLAGKESRDFGKKKGQTVPRRLPGGGGSWIE